MGRGGAGPLLGLLLGPHAWPTQVSAQVSQCTGIDLKGSIRNMMGVFGGEEYCCRMCDGIAPPAPPAPEGSAGKLCCPSAKGSNDGNYVVLDPPDESDGWLKENVCPACLDAGTCSVAPSIHLDNIQTQGSPVRSGAATPVAHGPKRPGSSRV